MKTSPCFPGHPTRRFPHHGIVAILLVFLLDRTLAQGAPVLQLDDRPTTGAIQQVRLLPEPLVPAGAPTADENAALGAALRDFAAGGGLEGLEDFAASHAGSAWSVSLRVNLGLLRFDHGYFSVALDHWNQAWAIGKGGEGSSPASSAQVARALAEAVKMNCRVGRVAEAKALLAEFGDRPVSGLAANMLDESRKAIIQMETMPADCFKCGPFAVSSIMTHLGKHTPETMATLTAYPTTAQGTSLAQVAELASMKLGMPLRPAKRLSGDSPIILPAVIHWNLTHYGALLEKKGDLYLMADPTFGTSQWISEDAIRKEGSGYFLVADAPLPDGWSAVGTDEAGTVWGRGDCAVGDGNGTGPNNPKVGCGGGGKGMPVWNVHHSLASLNIEDVPLSYEPAVGPEVAFRVNYSQLEQNQPTTMNFSNVGVLWNFSWLSYLTFDSANARARMGGGGTELFTNFNSGTGLYDPEQASGARLRKVSDTQYERIEQDGSKLVFSHPDGSGKIFLSQILDPQGNAVTMSYDANFRLVTLADASGRVTTITHGSNVPGDPRFYLVTQVTDPFGRNAFLNYDASQRLIAVTDQINLTSTFNYSAAGIIDSMTTPYGTTTFQCGSSNTPPKGVVSFVEVTQPDGGKHRVESLQYSTTPPSETVVPAGMPLLNQYLNFRNSYYWDPKGMAEGAGDYSKAYVSHFLHLNIASIKAAVIESEKAPLESRVWYFHQDQQHPIYTNQGMRATNPTHIGRVLDDGSTQLDRYSYNALGNMTQAIDPLGRTTNFTYEANGIDVATITQTNAQGGSDVLASYTWNSKHLPLTVTDASGATTTFTYNARGQLTSETTALGATTTYGYDAIGNLTSIDGAVPGNSDRLTYTYDAAGRVRTQANGENYTVTLDYDDFDRLTRITFPDGTYEAFTFDRLHMTSLRDRMGRTLNYTHDAMQRMTSVTDALNRVTRLEWCNCGSLSRLIDSQNRVTRWEQDIQGRTIAKIRADGSRQTLVYEKNTSRVSHSVDAKGQSKSYTLNSDDSIATISYPRAQQRTPSVSFTYDKTYPRLTSMTDGLGLTTYDYGAITDGGGANRLKETTLLWNGSKIGYQYDGIGRLSSRKVDGLPQTLTRDGGGRITGIDNALGHTGFTFNAASGLLTNVSLPNGQSVAASFYENIGDRRLQQLRNIAPNASTLSQFDYTYQPGGMITSWNRQLGGNPASLFSFTYDAVNQLTAASAPGASHSYTYDKSGNILTRSINSATTAYNYNLLDEIQSASPAVGGDKTYLWDGEDRLIGIDYAGTNLNTRLTYDGMGRCVEIVENDGAVRLSVRRYLWSGMDRCEERDASGTVTRRFFPQGEQIAGANYFYTFDHLGSVRELVDASGNVRARYDYDPFGVRTKVSGDLDASLGFTGHFYHAPSGLHFTLNRAYDAKTGRWLSRDPLGEIDGTNLYAYVSNSPVNQTDPLGLWTANVGINYSGTWAAGGGVTGGGSFGFIIDTQGNVGTYTGIGGGIAAGGPGAGAGISFGATSADTIYEATSGNEATASLSAAAGPRVTLDEQIGKKANGDGYLGLGASLGVGAGVNGSLTTGPSSATGFNIPDAARAAVDFLGLKPTNAPLPGSPAARRAEAKAKTGPGSKSSAGLKPNAGKKKPAPPVPRPRPGTRGAKPAGYCQS